MKFKVGDLVRFTYLPPWRDDWWSIQSLSAEDFGLFLEAGSAGGVGLKVEEVDDLGGVVLVSFLVSDNEVVFVRRQYPFDSSRLELVASPCPEPCDLTVLLQGLKGVSLYSTVHGGVILAYVGNDAEYPIVCYAVDDKGVYRSVGFTRDGRYLSGYSRSEVCLWPAVDVRDWSCFHVPPTSTSEKGTDVSFRVKEGSSL